MPLSGDAIAEEAHDRAGLDDEEDRQIDGHEVRQDLLRHMPRRHLLREAHEAEQCAGQEDADAGDGLGDHACGGKQEPLRAAPRANFDILGEVRDHGCAIDIGADRQGEGHHRVQEEQGEERCVSRPWKQAEQPQHDRQRPDEAAQHGDGEGRGLLAEATRQHRRQEHGEQGAEIGR